MYSNDFVRWLDNYYEREVLNRPKTQESQEKKQEKEGAKK